MTDIKTKADKVLSAYYDDEAHDPAFHLTGILREVINVLQVSPGVFWLGGTLYENRNKPTTPPSLKWKKRDT